MTASHLSTYVVFGCYKGMGYYKYLGGSLTNMLEWSSNKGCVQKRPEPARLPQEAQVLHTLQLYAPMFQQSVVESVSHQSEGR